MLLSTTSLCALLVYLFFHETCATYFLVFLLCGLGTTVVALLPSKLKRRLGPLSILLGLGWIACTLILTFSRSLCPVRAWSHFCSSTSYCTYSPVDVMFCGVNSTAGGVPVYGINTTCDGDGLIFAAFFWLFSLSAGLAFCIAGLLRTIKGARERARPLEPE